MVIFENPVTRITIPYDSIVLLKLDRHVFGCDMDLFFRGVYVPYFSTQYLTSPSTLRHREAILIRLHESGDCDSPENFRSMSLLSNSDKVFSYILNKTLTDGVEDSKKIVEEFRSGRSVIDNICELYSVVQKYLLKMSGKMYVCLVEFKKTFDTMNLNVLWNVLRTTEHSCKMITMF